MSEYSTVDFSVLLLMGTYVLSSFCSGKRGKRSVKVHLGALSPVCLSRGTDSPGGDTCTKLRSQQQSAPDLGVPCLTALLSELGLFILRLVRKSWYLLVGFLSFFPSGRAEESQEKTHQGREGGRSFGGASVRLELSHGRSLCLSTHTEECLSS